MNGSSQTFAGSTSVNLTEKAGWRFALVATQADTDDPEMFHTDLGQEYQIAQRALSFSDQELRELAMNSFQASFLPETRKREIVAMF